MSVDNRVRDARAQAEALFRITPQQDDGRAAIEALLRQADAEKIARLRALRLAREQAQGKRGRPTA